jgi:hypothetical protein
MERHDDEDRSQRRERNVPGPAAEEQRMTSSVPACVIPAMGVPPPFLMFVAVRAMAPVAGMPPNSGDVRFATLRHEPMLDRCRPPIMPSGDAEQRLDGPEQRDRSRPASDPTSASVTRGTEGCGRPRDFLNRPPIVSTGR